MKTSAKIFLMLLFIFALHITLYTLRGFAAIPHLINYQGRLTDSGGTSLNGSYALTFRIYDAATAGNLLWEETHTGVVIQKGIFGILLGSVNNLNLAFDKPYFLEIKVGNEVMSPRQQITSVGYAMRAEKAEEADKIKADNRDPATGYLSEKVDNSTIEVNASHKLQIKDGSLTPAKFANTIVGDAVEVSALTERTFNPPDYKKVKEISVGRNGNIRVKFEMRAGYPEDPFYAQIYKNGVPVGTERSTTSFSNVEFSEDINNVSAGNLIQLYCKTIDGGPIGKVTGRVKNFRICVANPMTSSINID